jgi:signal transduction histidine kinase
MTTQTHNTSLRSRIVIALVIITTVMSFLLAIGVLQIKDRLEEVIFGQTVQDQFEILQHQRETGEYSERYLFKNWRYYFGDMAGTLPPEIRDLDPGTHHSVIVNDQYYQVEVGLEDDQKVYLTYNITDWEKQEHEMLEMLAYGVGIVILAAILMGWQASKSILAPVRRLTDRLAAIQPRQRQVRIAGDFTGTEIGQIASAIDQYLGRLDQFVDRERSFTAAASHELRTPLAVMLGALDILDTQQLSGAGQRALTRLHRACEEMKAFISTTLFLSREESNTIEETSPVRFEEMLQTLLEDLQGLCEENGVRVMNQITPALELVWPRSLLQIVTGNILRNAIEHTRNGTITIKADTRQLSISDTGSGIPEHDLPHVFDRSYTTKETGTGMGLNLVKRICDRFNWKIVLESSPGKGTTVTVRFTETATA